MPVKKKQKEGSGGTEEETTKEDKKPPSRNNIESSINNSNNNNNNNTENESNIIMIRQLQAQIEAISHKYENIKVENCKIVEELTKTKEDSADIFEHVRQKINEKDAKIWKLEAKMLELQTEKDNIEKTIENRLKNEENENRETQEKLKKELKIVSDDLQELIEFRAQKSDILAEIQGLKDKLVEERRQNANRISELERKFVQEKDRLKKEMLEKIKEAKANLLKMTDTQLAATTKRTIMENEQISSELAFQSKRTTELMQTNEKLTTDNTSFKRMMDLSQQEQEEMAKKNTAAQKVIKMLISKVKVMEENRKDDIHGWEIRREEMIASRRQEISKLQDEIEVNNVKIEELNKILNNMSEEKKIIANELQRVFSVVNEAANFVLNTLVAIKNEKHSNNNNNNNNNSSSNNNNTNEIDEIQEKEKILKFLVSKLNSTHQQVKPLLSNHAATNNNNNNSNSLKENNNENTTNVGLPRLSSASSNTSANRIQTLIALNNGKNGRNIAVQTDSLWKSAFEIDKLLSIHATIKNNTAMLYKK